MLRSKHIRNYVVPGWEQKGFLLVLPSPRICNAFWSTDQFITSLAPVIYPTYPGDSFEYFASLPWHSCSLQKDSLLFPGPHPPRMDLCRRILAHEVSFQAAQPLFQTVPSEQACSLALRKWFGSSASTFSEGSCRTQQLGQSEQALTPAAAHQHMVLLQHDTQNAQGLRSKRWRVKICVTHTYYSQRGEEKQEGRNTQLNVKGEWPQVGTVPAEA